MIDVESSKLIVYSKFASLAINRKRVLSYFLISESGSPYSLGGTYRKPGFEKSPSTVIFSGSIVPFSIKLVPVSSTNLIYNSGNAGSKSEQSIPLSSSLEQLVSKIPIKKRVSNFFHNSAFYSDSLTFSWLRSKCTTTLAYKFQLRKIGTIFRLS